MLYTPRMRVFAALFTLTLAGASLCSAQKAQWLKPIVPLAFPARLKSCPVTKPWLRGALPMPADAMRLLADAKMPLNNALKDSPASDRKSVVEGKRGDSG